MWRNPGFALWHDFFFPDRGTRCFIPSLIQRQAPNAAARCSAATAMNTMLSPALTVATRCTLRARPVSENGLTPSYCVFQSAGMDYAAFTAPLVGIIGAMQAGEALKLLMNLKQGLHSELLSLEALNIHALRTRLGRDPACPVCSNACSPFQPPRNDISILLEAQVLDKWRNSDMAIRKHFIPPVPVSCQASCRQPAFPSRTATTSALPAGIGR